MADYKFPPYVEERVRYFDGQFLQDQDFIDEQKYHIDRQRRHNRYLHATGIIEGLTVDFVAKDKATVAAGTALDGQGRQIVLGTQREVPVSGYTVASVLVVIEFKENESHPTTEGSAGNSRFQAHPEVTVVDDGVIPTDGIVLAVLNLTNGDIESVDSSPRVYSGLNLPCEADGTGPILRPVDANHATFSSVEIDPANKLRLSVIGTVRGAHGAGETEYTEMGHGGSHGYINTAGDGNLDFRHDGSTKMSLTTAGNVGIGLTNPATKLVIEGDSATTQVETAEFVRLLRPVVSGVKNSNSAGFSVGAFEPGIAGRARLDIKLSGTPVGGNGWGSVPNVTVMSLCADNKVGIGISAPGANLDVTGKKNTSGQVSLQLRSGNSSAGFASNQLTLGYDGTANFRHAIKTRHHGGQRSGNAIDFYVWKNLAADNKDAVQSIGSLHTMSLDGGYVGIGVTNPSGLLHLNGSSPIVRIYDKDLANGDKSRLRIGRSDSPNQALGIEFQRHANTSTASFHFLGDAFGDSLVLQKGGRVGIGTTSPVSRLTINARIAEDANYGAYGNAQLSVFESNHNGGDTPNGTRDIVHLVRAGVNGQAYGNKVSLALGRFENDATNSRTQLDVKLTDGSFNSHNTIMSLRSNGFVGIGVPAPGAHLDIIGKKNTSGQVSLQLRSGNQHNKFDSNQITLGFDGSVNYRHAIKTRHRASSRSGNAIDFYVWKYLSATDKDANGDIGSLHAMTLDGGNVGIGTTAPGRPLQIGHTGGDKSGMIKLAHSVSSPRAYRAWDMGVGDATFFGNLDNFGFRDLTGNKTVMVLEKGTGHVGIGTTNPISNLHMRAKTAGATSRNSLLVLDAHDDSNDYDLGYGASAGILFKIPYGSTSKIGAAIDAVRRSTSDTNSSTGLNFSVSGNNETLVEALAINGSGSVGIGTTAPQQKTHVKTSGSNGLQFGMMLQNPNNTDTGGTATGILFSTETGTFGKGALVFERLESYARGSIHFLQHNSANTTKPGLSNAVMTITRGGNVGIGTTSPSQKLSVIGVVRGAKDAAETEYTEIGHSGTTGYINTVGDGQLRFRHDGSTKMTITDAGNVGIGTTNPKIHLAIGDNDTGLKQQGDGKLAIYTNDSERVRITNTGRVGIGTTSPANKLEVKGWTYITGGAGLRFYKSDKSEYWTIYPEWNDANDPDLFFDYSENSSSWVTGWLHPTGGWEKRSDRQVKKDIEPIKNALSQVMKLRPSYFRWLEDKADAPRTVGLIAQEVEKVFPDLVREKRKLLGLNYDHFGILAIAALQEQQKLISKLEKDVSKLKSEVKSLATT